MIERIQQALSANRICVYQITEKQTERMELYFIRKHLDMRRATRGKTYTVTVFRDFSQDGVEYRGSANFLADEEMEEQELDGKVRAAYYAASFVKNRFYPLPKGEKSGEVKEVPGNLSGDWQPFAMKTADAIFAEDTREDVFLNSLEVFVTCQQVRIVTSGGIDVAYRKYLINGEFVAQCLTPQDVETYEDFRYDSFDEKEIRAKVARVLQMTKDRAAAVKAPEAGEYRVILSGKYVAPLFDYYYERSHASMVYPGYSNYKVGDDVQMAGSDEPVTGERLNVRLLATTPYSGEGIAMEDRELLADGKLQLIFGDSRFCYYLGVAPTGNYGKTQVKPGTVSFEEMKRQPYLQVVNFSDFQMDGFTGNFGGEIRLAYLFDGEKVTPVTGGSINGSILQMQKKFVFSKETQEDTSFSGPLAVAMEGVAVAGC